MVLDCADSIGSAMKIGEAAAEGFSVSSRRDCCCVRCSDSPTCLRMAFSVTPHTPCDLTITYPLGSQAFDDP